MVLVLKTSVGQLTASSNLALSAKKKTEHLLSFFLGIRISPFYPFLLLLKSIMKIPPLPINRLEIVALVNGFVLMVFELAGARILAPGIGSSTYVWTSVIGVIIAALSLGYFVGGKVADKRGYLIDVARLALLTGILITVTIISYQEVISVVASDIADPRIQGVIASLILFAPASFILGASSPYLAKLNVRSLKTTGRSVASLSALNSIGGIVGTFTAGFFLFGFVGSYETLCLTVILLLAASWIIGPRVEWKMRLFITAAILTVIFISPIKSSVVSIDTPTAHYTVADTPSGFRELRMGPYGAQSTINLKRPDELATWYTRQFDSVIDHVPQKKDILMLGGGAFMLPQHLAYEYPDSNIDVVEIDPELASVARRYFDYRDPKNIDLIFTDARAYVNQTKTRYDVVLVDVYGDIEVPFTFLTKEYGKRIKEIVKPGGVVAVNMVAGTQGACLKLFEALDAPYRKHFGSATYVIQSPGETRSNLVVAYSDKPVGMPDSSSLEFSRGVLYSDNFAPAERLQYACTASTLATASA